MHFKRELLDACIQGDRKAQKELYEKCFAPLLSICFRFANNKDDAVVLLNTAFFKILENLPSQNPQIPFFAWAKRVCINCCIDAHKKTTNYSKHITPFDDPDAIEHESNLELVSDDEDSGYSAELLAKVKEQILQLPPTTQEVFQLFALEGYSHKEIAEILEMKEGTSKWHVNNARKILKEAIKMTSKILSSFVL